MSEAIPLIPLYAFMALTGKVFFFLHFCVSTDRPIAMKRRRPFGRTKYEWEDNIKMSFIELGHAR